VLIARIGELEVSVLGLGTSHWASLGSRLRRSDAARLLDAASDLGITLIDTADTYGSSDCERMLGELLARRPGRFHVATKGGLATADLPRPLRPANQFVKKALQAAGRSRNFSPNQIAKCIDSSLRRLRSETLDIYFLHSPPAAAVGDPDLLAVLEHAVAAGKIRHLGVSSDDREVLARAAELPGIDVVQTRVNPLPGIALRTVAGKLTDRGIGVVANQAIAMGLVRSDSSQPRGRDEAELVNRIDRAAAEHRCSRACVLLRHALAQPGVRAVLARTSNLAHLHENAEALATGVTTNDSLVTSHHS
jgi:aryl-alcohol dehydrogenase-like predicted oxidoreductase